MTSSTLTPAMRTALVNALAGREHGFSRLTASDRMVEALIARGLAYRSLDEGQPFLAPAGDLIAARLFDRPPMPLRTGIRVR